MQSPLYNVITENQLTEILSHYSTQYVMSVIENAMRSRFQMNSALRMPNVVASWEQNFKQYLADFDESSEGKQKILAVRDETYREIVQRICAEFHLSFTIDEDVDWYSTAYYLYDFFVCNFITNMVNFFASYIFREKDGLYDSMGLSDMRKSKDASTIYGKKVYKDIKLAVINTNIDAVINFISAADINLPQIFGMVYHQPELVYKMCSTVVAQTDFYKEFYIQLLQSPIRPIILTEIRLSLQNMAVETADPADENQE